MCSPLSAYEFSNTVHLIMCLNRKVNNSTNFRNFKRAYFMPSNQPVRKSPIRQRKINFSRVIWGIHAWFPLPSTIPPDISIQSAIWWTPLRGGEANCRGACILLYTLQLTTTSYTRFAGKCVIIHQVDWRGWWLNADVFQAPRQGVYCIVSRFLVLLGNSRNWMRPVCALEIRRSECEKDFFRYNL